MRWFVINDHEFGVGEGFRYFTGYQWGELPCQLGKSRTTGDALTSQALQSSILGKRLTSRGVVNKMSWVGEGEDLVGITNLCEFYLS